MLSASRRLVLTAACAASLLAPAAAHAARTYDATATGTIEYVRKDVFPGPGTNANSYQVTLAFKTVVEDVTFGVDHNMIGHGTATTTVSDVKAVDHSVLIVPPAVSKTGSCSAATGAVVAPGTIGDDPVTPLDGSRQVDVRILGEVDFGMHTCSGELGVSHEWPLNPWGEPLGESALDAQTVIPAGAFSGDVWSGDLTAARPTARCPGFLDAFTTQCSIAIAGQLQLQRATGEPSTDPTPAPAPAPAPKPPVWQPEGPATTSRDGRLTSRSAWANGGRKLRTKVSCAAGCTGTITFGLPGGGKAIGRPVRVNLAPGQTKTVVLSLTRGQSRVLQQQRKLSVRFTAAPATATPSAKRTARLPRR